MAGNQSPDTVVMQKEGATSAMNSVFDQGFAAGEPLVVEDITQVLDELKDKLQMVRHGFGIQIYPSGAGRYAGDWYHNKKTGDGHMVFQDGSEYRGGLVDGVKNGHGFFKWPKSVEGGDCTRCDHMYCGYWKDGKMHGEGAFQHRDQFVIQPCFSNNLALISDGNFVNPFMSQD